ncbi:pilus (MSHA type) biogenesis protein MshL [Duganella violaceipulchra]|uniref:MSHA biogenesis protein MshL n=1 Tax=Duganella violaceipulchra TaxID=2849652 RepID=A0AA41HFW8_9BURK|nr:pilus (MSHA type) biogenesis protein MshL [Duganella violaceicalia]MBV6323406.1 pilus (MSHA type) biogenesis protein MshL [Duganella violaceicalia]MCP2007640.1 MSHA biogenesis protein MshL [Duganella violaceicalia]
MSKRKHSLHPLLRWAGFLGAAAALAGCQTQAPRDTYNTIDQQVRDAAANARAQPASSAAVEAALLPPPAATMAAELPKARAVMEERFNVSFNQVPVQQFYNSIVAGTRYNMLIHPDVSGTVTANLKDVTLFEALDAVREMYGYDYKVEGTRIYIRPLTMQTRIFQVNYLSASRKGTSNVRVSSTSVNTVGSVVSGQSGNSGSNGQSNQPQQQGQGNQQYAMEDSSNVKTSSATDFWTELKEALVALVGGVGDGRSVVISPQSGVVVVRALPEQLRSVDQYLKATRLAVERQVILEAKILEVQLNSGFQSGINWASFASFGGGGSNRLSGGFLAPGTGLAPLPASGGQPAVITSGGTAGISAITGSALVSAANNAGSLFGLAFQTSNFAAMISFLESQGSVHVLSSPRIATMNNQKAVLKIGTDEFYVTGVSTTTNSNVSGNTTSPNVTLQPFFSGVVLDVTPQIDDEGNIMLHVHPSVSQVSTVNKVVNLGSAGSLQLPLAASSTSEMDSMVRGQDGRIVAIGGLMRQSSVDDNSQAPGISSVPVLGALFRNTERSTQKRELVVLIKPTIVDGAASYAQDLDDASRRVQQLAPPAGGRK